MDDTQMELINRYVDGDLSPDEKAEMDTRLETDADARALAGDLRLLVGALDRIEAIEPPEGLKASIMASLPAGRYPVVPRSAPHKSLWSSLRDIVVLRPRMAVAYAFSVGLLLGVIGFGLLGGGAGETTPESVVGTMAPSATTSNPEIIATATVDTDEFSGRVHLLSTPEGAVVRIALDRPTEGSVVLGFPEDGYTVRGFRPSDGAADYTLDVDGSGVRVIPTDARAIDVLLNEPASSSTPISLRVEREGVLYEQLLSPAQ